MKNKIRIEGKWNKAVEAFKAGKPLDQYWYYVTQELEKVRLVVGEKKYPTTIAWKDSQKICINYDPGLVNHAPGYIKWPLLKKLCLSLADQLGVELPKIGMKIIKVVNQPPPPLYKGPSTNDLLKVLFVQKPIH